MSAITIFSRLQNLLHTTNPEDKKLNYSSFQAESITSTHPTQGMRTEILTLGEAATYLRVDPHALLGEVTQGSIPACQIGGEWRFSLTAIESALNTHLSRGSIDLEQIPNHDWEYAEAWTTCIKIRRLVREIQEMMHSGHTIHELVVAPSFEEFTKVLKDFYRQTETREEGLQYQYFQEIGDWKKNAQNYYKNYELTLGTWVFRNSPQYQLLFQDLAGGEMVTNSSELPVQTEWTPLEDFWKDSRRYDYKYYKTS
jgi:hypothetical protein